MIKAIKLVGGGNCSINSNERPLNNDIQGSFKKLSLFFHQAEMVSVIVWFLDHFTLEYVPSANRVAIIAFVSHLYAWVTKF